MFLAFGRVESARSETCKFAEQAVFAQFSQGIMPSLRVMLGVLPWLPHGGHVTSLHCSHTRVTQRDSAVSAWVMAFPAGG